MKISTLKLTLEMARAQKTIGDICEKSGLPRVTVSQVFRGVRNPKPKTVGKIAAALGVDVTELLED